MRFLKHAGSPEFAQLFLAQERVKGVRAVLNGTEAKPVEMSSLWLVWHPLLILLHQGMY